MSGLDDAIRHIFRCLGRFGRPDRIDATDARDDKVDTRLSSLERKQRDIRARLRLLEIQSDPRGISDDL